MDQHSGEKFAALNNATIAQSNDDEIEGLYWMTDMVTKNRIIAGLLIIVTGMFLAIVGDAIAQAREPHPYDAKRAYGFAALDGSYRVVQQITYPPLLEWDARDDDFAE
jgi:hypothetical protein